MTDSLTPSQYNADLAADYGDLLEDTYDPDLEPLDARDADQWEAWAAFEDEDPSVYWNDVEQGMYDDDPSPYNGDYSEM